VEGENGWHVWKNYLGPKSKKKTKKKNPPPKQIGKWVGPLLLVRS